MVVAEEENSQVSILRPTRATPRFRGTSCGPVLLGEHILGEEVVCYRYEVRVEVSAYSGFGQIRISVFRHMLPHELL
jgi:hypothetical protein